MVARWSDEEVQFGQAVAFNKELLVCIGIYVHEFVCSLRFDWMLLRRDDSQRAPLARCVKWLYMLCRYSALATCVTVSVIGLSQAHLDCQTMIKFINGTALAAVTSATVLLFVRVGVVWAWDKRLTAAFALGHLVVVAVGIRGVVLVEGEYTGIPSIPACNTLRAVYDAPSVLSSLVLDAALLFMLLVGLRRWHNPNASAIWRLLWNQGLVYLAITIIVEIPLTVLLFLSDHEIVFLFLDLPFTLMLPMAATRLYRSLTTFSSGKQGGLEYESMYKPPEASSLGERYELDIQLGVPLDTLPTSSNKRIARSEDSL
ncbi:unnamed protein product [Peniophora sp. CBMAI 1063]|nr:unnamed protein product [Peniophora sp. CBMAI 1063]